MFAFAELKWDHILTLKLFSNLLIKGGAQEINFLSWFQVWAIQLYLSTQKYYIFIVCSRSFKNMKLISVCEVDDLWACHYVKSPYLCSIIVLYMYYQNCIIAEFCIFFSQ